MIKTPKSYLSPRPYNGKNIFYYRRPESATISKTLLNTDEISLLFSETREIYKEDSTLKVTLPENDIIPTKST